MTPGIHQDNGLKQPRTSGVRVSWEFTSMMNQADGNWTRQIIQSLPTQKTIVMPLKNMSILLIGGYATEHIQWPITLLTLQNTNCLLQTTHFTGTIIKLGMTRFSQS